MRTNEETENAKKSQTEQGSETSDLTKTSEGSPLTNGETKSEQTATTTEKLHIQTDSSAKVGSANGAGSGSDFLMDGTSFTFPQSPLVHV